MEVIVQKIRQRAAVGKSTAFRVRGQRVDPAKIERWKKTQRRSGTQHSNLDATFSPNSGRFCTNSISSDEPS
jgi:hypothetical protein